jgi:hypothetical protein
MSLDSRLRTDLHQLADTIEPSTDAALRAVLRRRERRARVRTLAPRLVAAAAAVLVVAGFVTWRLSGSGADETPVVKEPQPPVGTYGSVLSGDLVGDWRLRFGQGTVSLLAPDARVLGTRLAHGTYDIGHGAITTDLLADGPCSGPGSYTWRKAGGGLAFMVVDDTCDLRVRLLTTSPWTPVTGAPLPEGTYETPPLTVDQLRRSALSAGFTQAEADENLGYEGVHSVTFTLQIVNGGWTEFETVDGAPPQVGWNGPYDVVDDATIVAGDPPCGPITYDYRLVGDQLSLVVVDDLCREGTGPDSAPVGELVAQTVIYETAPFTRLAE